MSLVTRRINSVAMLAAALGGLLLCASTRAGDEKAAQAGQAADAQPANEPSTPATRGRYDNATGGQSGFAFYDADSDGWLDLFVAGSPRHEAAKLSEYWIGIDGSPADQALRAQLDLPEGQGIVVNQVVDESPAAEAGLTPYDVLLAAGDTPLTALADLAKIVEEKKEAAIPIRLVRGGKRITIEVTPRRRPASQTGETCPVLSKLDDAEFARRVWAELIGKPADEGRVHQFAESRQPDKRTRLVNRLLLESTVAARSCRKCHATTVEEGARLANVPLVTWFDRTRTPLVLQDGVLEIRPYIAAGARPELPDDVTISIIRKGKEPVRITVERGEQRWGATEADFRKTLPAEFIPHVEALLGAGTPDQHSNVPHFTADPSLVQWLDATVLQGLPAEAVPRFTWNQSGIFWLDSTARPGLQPAEDKGQKPSGDPALDAVTGQIDALARELEKLRQAVETLRAKNAAPPAEPGKRAEGKDQ